MAYTPQEWADGEAGGTPITAEALSTIETGIADAHSTADAAAPASHNHAAGDVTSGTFTAARIPTLAQSKVTGLEAALQDLEGRIAALEAAESGA